MILWSVKSCSFLVKKTGSCSPVYKLSVQFPLIPFINYYQLNTNSNSPVLHVLKVLWAHWLKIPELERYRELPNSESMSYAEGSGQETTAIVSGPLKLLCGWAGRGWERVPEHPRSLSLCQKQKPWTYQNNEWPLYPCWGEQN